MSRESGRSDSEHQSILAFGFFAHRQKEKSIGLYHIFPSSFDTLYKNKTNTFIANLLSLRGKMNSLDDCFSEAGKLMPTEIICRNTLQLSRMAIFHMM